MTGIWAETALTADGWRRSVRVEIGADGRISRVAPDAAAQPGDHRVGLLAPALGNLHSHAFQRAMAGLTERRGGDGLDSFWTWRALMFRFLDQLTPDDVEAIAAMVQLEMLEAGFAAVGEFHYLHHRPDGGAYDAPGEMAARIAAAAAETGIGLTLLPVLYEQGGCDGRPLAPGQRRFGAGPDAFARLLEAAAASVAALPPDTRLGVAPHSLRAVPPASLHAAIALADGLGPETRLHIHAAEQTAEVAEVAAALGARPVEWLLANADLGARWCLIHATHMTPGEVDALAASGAVVGLCPLTESNLGDGVFEGVRYLEAGGRFGIGSDSNIRIALGEELRTLEHSQRLRDRARARMASAGRSVGRTLYETAAEGGARALARDAGRLEPGRLADLLAVDLSAPALIAREGDALLDSLVFAAGDGLVADVWSAGRHVVRDGRAPAHDRIVARFGATLRALTDRL